MKPSEALLDFGNPVAFYPGLVKYLGSVNATLFFCQILFHTGKEQSPDLGVYKTAEEIRRETGLTREEQRTARRNLRDRGILIETENRLEHRIYYRLDLEEFDRTPPTPKSGKPNGHCEIPTPPLGVGPTVHTEKTTERTTESKPLRAAPQRAAGDQRHTLFREALDAYFQHKNGVPAPWDGKEAAHLARWLKANPTITAEHWRNILRHRARSPVNHALALSAWLAKALTWLEKPQDEWGRETGAAGAQSKTARNMAALAESLAAGKPEGFPRPHGLFPAGGAGQEDAGVILLSADGGRPARLASGAG